MLSPQDLQEVVALERLLLDPAVRESAERLRGLLHPEYLELGATGRVWDLESTLAALTDDPAMDSGEPEDFTPVALADDAVLLTYRITGARGSLRSSIWVREPGSDWRLRFHQGTLS